MLTTRQQIPWEDSLDSRTRGTISRACGSPGNDPVFQGALSGIWAETETGTVRISWLWSRCIRHLPTEYIYWAYHRALPVIDADDTIEDMAIAKAFVLGECFGDHAFPKCGN